MKKNQETYYIIHKLNHQLTTYINKNLKNINVTRSEAPYLITLYIEDCITQENLSKKLEYNEATITRALRRLEKKDLVERIPNMEDRREKIVKLTETGKKAAKTILDKHIYFRETIFEDFTEEECNQFNEYSRRLSLKILKLLESEES